MNPMNFHRLRGNWKALSAALGVGVLITMGAGTLAYPISAVGTSSDSWKADTRITLTPSPSPPSVAPKVRRRNAITNHRTLASTAANSGLAPLVHRWLCGDSGEESVEVVLIRGVDQSTVPYRLIIGRIVGAIVGLFGRDAFVVEEDLCPVPPALGHRLAVDVGGYFLGVCPAICRG
jgi:hypothetical protein